MDQPYLIVPVVEADGGIDYAIYKRQYPKLPAFIKWTRNIDRWITAADVLDLIPAVADE